MTFDELVLHNFSLYRGRQEITLTPRIGKPIILFGGLNGSGKTTILDALQLVLYGKFARCSNRGTASYDRFLRDCIHRDVDPTTGAAIELQFRHTAAGSEHTYRIHRSWSCGTNGVRERFEVLLDGNIDSVLSETWPEHVDGFLPARLAHLFFFDGEKIEGLADFESSSDLLRTAIHSVLGLDVVDRLATDLVTLERRKRVALKNTQERIEIEQLQMELERFDQELGAVLQERAAAQNELDLKAKRLHEARIRFEREGGESYQRRAEIEAERQSALHKLRAVQDELRELAEGAGPLLLVTSALERIMAQDKAEDAANRAAAMTKVLSDRDARLLQELKRSKFTKIAIKTIEAILGEDRIRFARSTKGKTYLELGANGRQSLQFLRSALLPTTRARIQKLVAEARCLSGDLVNAERALSNVPNEDSMLQLFEQRQREETAALEAQVRVTSLQTEADRRQRLRDQLQQKMIRAIEEQVDSDFDREDVARTITHSERVRIILQNFREEIARNHVLRIQGLVLDSFHQLLRKRTLVSGLTIDPQEFVVRLLNGNEKPLAPDRLAAGERQLLAVSLLWGLARASGRPLPVVTDTPLGRLDATHRTHLVERYFPHASHQMLLLSTDEEINETYYEKLKPWISHCYRLTFHEDTGSTVVSPGYFW